MARAHSIWIVHVGCEDCIIGAFTVKYEMISKLEEIKKEYPGEDLIVSRVKDGYHNKEVKVFQIEDLENGL